MSCYGGILRGAPTPRIDKLATEGMRLLNVHITGRETRQINEVLRQRCFFVRQRTMLRNRIIGSLAASTK